MESVVFEQPQAWAIGELVSLLPLELQPLLFDTHQNGFDALNYRILNKFWLKNWARLLPQFCFGASPDPFFINHRPLINFPNVESIELNLTHIDKQCQNMDEFFMHLLAQPKLKILTVASIRDNLANLIEALKKYGHKLEKIGLSSYLYPRDYAPGNQLIRVVADFCPNVTSLDFSLDANDLSCLAKLKHLRTLQLGKASAADVNSLRATPNLLHLEAEYASIDAVNPECLKSFINLKYLLLGGGNVEQQYDEPNSKTWLKEFMVERTELCQTKLPKQIGLNCKLAINVSSGQADNTAYRTLLELAIECRNEECVKILLDSGLIDICGSDVCLALEYDASVELARLLLDRNHRILPYLGPIIRTGVRILDLTPDELEEHMQMRLFCVPSYEEDEEDYVDTSDPPRIQLRQQAALLASTAKDDTIKLLVDVLSVYAPREAETMSPDTFYSYLCQKQVIKSLVDAQSHEKLWAAIEDLPQLQPLRRDIDEYTRYKLKMSTYQWQYA